MITKKRLDLFNLKAVLSQQNAENTTFDDQLFDHVNCQGVIHYTQNTQASIKVIVRVLKQDGIACVSVYYSNVF